MKSLDSNLACPACQTALTPKVLACDSCGIRMEGPFQLNEFATLSSEDLHFLRIFVQAEGRIREMESALGLSYPTIRTRLTALKNRLAATAPKAESSASGQTGPGESETKDVKSDVQSILAQLEKGEISYELAMRKIRELRT